jgi:hypothetical protein
MLVETSSATKSSHEHFGKNSCWPFILANCTGLARGAYLECVHDRVPSRFYDRSGKQVGAAKFPILSRPDCLFRWGRISRLVRAVRSTSILGPPETVRGWVELPCCNSPIPVEENGLRTGAVSSDWILHPNFIVVRLQFKSQDHDPGLAATNNPLPKRVIQAWLSLSY